MKFISNADKSIKHPKNHCYPYSGCRGKCCKIPCCCNLRPLVVSGPTGATGPTGAAGSTGSTGATGPAADRSDFEGTIIPYSTGSPVNIFSYPGQEPGFYSVGFALASMHQMLDTGARRIAFCVPRPVIIEALSVSFNIRYHTENRTGATLFAQLYYSPMNSEDFMPVPETLLALSPRLSSGELPEGYVISGYRSGLSVSLPAGTKLSLSYFIETEDPEESFDAIGQFHAGIMMKHKEYLKERRGENGKVKCCQDSCRSHLCPTAPTGVTGSTGPTGPVGSTGATGPPGPESDFPGTMIPYSSAQAVHVFYRPDVGGDVFMNTSGFGYNVSHTGSDPISDRIAFCMPFPVKIEALSASFNTLYEIENIGSAALYVQLYLSPIHENAYEPIPGVQLALSPVFPSGIIPADYVVAETISGLSISVPANVRVSLSYYLEVENLFEPFDVVGQFHAGMNLI